jgi:hypothetical protein
VNRLRAEKQRADIASYFKKAFYFANIDKSDNVLAYAVKRARGFKLIESNWSYFEAFLLRTGRINWTAIPAIAQILIDARARGYQLSADRIEKFINDVLRKVIPITGTTEICWLLFLAKGVKSKISAGNVKALASVESGAVALLCLDLDKRGLLDAALDINFWEQTIQVDGLRGHMWLLLYEGVLKGWIDPKWTVVVKGDVYFSELLKKKVSFYDVKRNVPRIKLDLRRMFNALRRRRYIFAHLSQYE